MNPSKTSSFKTVFLKTVVPLEKLSWLLDAAFAIPGTRWRIGLDALLGFIPGIGDTIGAAFSTYIIYEAARLGASKRTLLRMVGNVACEALVGVVPIVGDIFDIAWRANMRNVELLRAEPILPDRPYRSSKQIAVLFATSAGCILILFLLFSLFIIQWLYHLITG